MKGDEEEFAVEVRDAPPAHLLVKIQHFSKLSKHGIREHKSREFVAGKYKWKLIIYPNGRDCNYEDNYISVYLSVADADTLPEGWKAMANCSIFLHNQISDNYLCYRVKGRRFDAMNSKWGFSISKRMLAEPSHGYLVDDKCVFGAEVLFSKTTPAVECLSLFDWKISDFSQLKTVWKSEVFHAGGFQWKMKLFPNGNRHRDAEGKTVSIYLECVDRNTFSPHEKVKADFCIRIKNKLPQAHCSWRGSHWFTSEEDDWGRTDFIPISDMCDPSKGFIIDGCCFLETEISVQDAVYKSLN